MTIRREPHSSWNSIRRCALILRIRRRSRMAERDGLLTALVAEILGPRTGAREILRSDEDPLDEYITGVLAPHQTASVEIDAEEDLVGDDESVGDDQADPGAGVA